MINLTGNSGCYLWIERSISPMILCIHPAWGIGYKTLNITSLRVYIVYRKKKWNIWIKKESAVSSPLCSGENWGPWDTEEPEIRLQQTRWGWGQANKYTGGYVTVRDIKCPAEESEAWSDSREKEKYQILFGKSDQGKEGEDLSATQGWKQYDKHARKCWPQCCVRFFH